MRLFWTGPARNLWLLPTLLLLVAVPASAVALIQVQVQKDGVRGVDGLDGAYGVPASPDGKHIYVPSLVDDAVVVKDGLGAEAQCSRQYGKGCRK